MYERQRDVGALTKVNNEVSHFTVLYDCNGASKEIGLFLCSQGMVNEHADVSERLYRTKEEGIQTDSETKDTQLR